MAPLLIIVFLGGYFLIAGVFVLSLITIREYSNAFGERKPAGWAMVTSLIILYAGFLVPAFKTPWFFMLWLFVSLVLCFISMFAMEKMDLLQGMITVAGVFYINFLAFHIVLVDYMFTMGKQSGIFWLSGLNSYVWIIVLAAFGTDIFAYFTGKVFGKHKLCPSISPKKTVEGSVGGVIGSVILCGIFGWFFIPGGFVNCIIIGVAGSIISQVGDLSASVMKRKIGIKDWGTLIPGHGGVLDRIDSMLFTAPLVLYFLVLKEVIF